jgi:CubicO group peptidase (beta-lactamase class C family)
MRQMKKLYLLLIFSFASLAPVISQTLYYPPNVGNTWATISPSELGWCAENIDSLEAYLQATSSKGYIILKNGRIVLERYFGTFTRDSIWYWASAGKTVTAFLVGKAQEEGLLSLQDSTSKFLGTGWTIAPPDKERLITVWHQLTMTSGLDDSNPATRDCTIDTCLKYLADAGTRWAYHNAPYTLLDKVIENAANSTFNQYFFSRLRNPVGMNGIFLKPGFLNVYFSNLRSMARFGLLMQSKGKWNGNTILGDTNFLNAAVNTSQNINLSYGYLWWLNGKSSFMLPQSQIVFPGMLMPDAPADMYAALGRDGQILNVVPSQGLVFVRMGNQPDESGSITALYNNRIWQRINKLPCVTQNNELYSATMLKAYPNPGKNTVMVKNLQKDTEYWLVNSLGSLISKGTCDYRLELDVQNIPEGIYTIILRFNNAQIHQLRWIKSGGN